MKRTLSLSLVVLLLLSLFAGCASGGTAPATDSGAGTEAAPSAGDQPGASGDKPAVGLALPTKEQYTWVAQGEELNRLFAGAGYETVLEYAEDVVERQITQIENMILKGCGYIIIASVDGYALSDTVQKARDSGATVIALDRLIMNTEAVDYYLTFDLFRMGEIQGQYIESALGLPNQDGPFTLEIFSGSPDDSNSIPFYEGAMSVLRPYIDAGKLVVNSGQVDLNVTGTLKWDSATAQSRMDNILSAFYSGQRVDAVLCAADCLALGVISSLNSMGYGSGDMPFPVITGQDCELTNVRYILEGMQSMSVMLDHELSSAKMLDLVEQLEAGTPIAPDAAYNNDMIDVPTITYDPVLIDADNYTLLIERGFFTEDELS